MVMKNYYFTFGQIHKLSDGYSMKDHWVKVEAQDYGPYLERPLGWAFQYNEEDFMTSNYMYFPKGEYKFIKQKNNQYGNQQSRLNSVSIN
jgi:hypothetical protein